MHVSSLRCICARSLSERSEKKSRRHAQATSELVRKVLAHVRESHPYWDRRDGADHFMVFSYDHGRCDMALNLEHSEWGQMFAIQSYGDLTYT